MAHRVRVSVDTFKVSAPGIDVLTAADADLVFDGGGLPYNGVYLHGVVLASAFTETSHSIIGGTQYVRTATLNFGRTFPSVPRIMCGIFDPLVTGDLAFVSNPNLGTVTQTTGDGSLHGSTMSMVYSVTTTGVTFTITYNYYDGTSYNRQRDVPYIIFQV